MDYTEQTTPDAISLGGIVLTTVTRYTNGISSAFYVGKLGENGLQYTNGNNYTPPDHGNMTATLIGNFEYAPDNIDNIVIAVENDVHKLTVKGLTGSTDDITFYMAKGAMVPNFALAAKDGYKLIGYYSDDISGELMILDGRGGGGAAVDKNSDEELYASMAAAKFTDVKITDYFAAPVGWALENKVTSGISESLFAPNTACSRAQVVTFLYRYFAK